MIKSQVLGVAIAATLASAAVTAATSPYQSSQRTAIGSGLGQSDMPKGGTFEPRIGAAVQYVDNINLAEDGEPKTSLAGLELSPGFYASYSLGPVIAAIDYSLIARAWEDSDYDDISHQLSANGQWAAIPEWFSVSGQASYQDAVLDPIDGLNYGGLGIFGPSNLTEVASASVSPVLQHTFNYAVFTAQYSYGRTWYLDEGKGFDQPTIGFVSNQDSTDQSAGVSVGTADTGSRLSGQLYYDWSRSEFETAIPFEYERAGIDAGYQVSRTITLLGEYGKESDLEASTTQGGLDSEFWSAGLRWDPNENSSIEGRYGERFFGESWSFSASHQARLLQFEASYSEEPTVETQQLSLGSFNPGELPGGLPDVDFGRFNSLPYIARNADASVRAEGSRTSLGLRVFQQERDYITGQRQDEDSLGAAFDVTRKLASNLDLDFSLSYQETEQSFSSTGQQTDLRSSDDLQAVLRLNRQAGQSLTFSAETGYLTSSGDREYDGWWVGLRGLWTP